MSVPDEALGDGYLDPNEEFTVTFSVGLGDKNFGGTTIGADGIPFNWVLPDVEPSYDANDGPFVFGAFSAPTSVIAPTRPARPVRASPTYAG